MTLLPILNIGLNLILTIDPIGTAAIFGILTLPATAMDRARVAIQATTAATAILSLIAHSGFDLLIALGIGLSAVRIGGALLLLAVAWRMGTARADTTTKTSARATLVITTYLLAGPACITTTILSVAQARGDGLDWRSVVAALIVIQGMALVCLLSIPGMIVRYGARRAHIVSRAAAFLLAAMAVKTLTAGLAGL